MQKNPKTRQDSDMILFYPKPQGNQKINSLFCFYVFAIRA